MATVSEAVLPRLRAIPNVMEARIVRLPRAAAAASFVGKLKLERGERNPALQTAAKRKGPALSAPGLFIAA